MLNVWPIYLYIYHKFIPNVGKYTKHWASGIVIIVPDVPKKCPKSPCLFCTDMARLKAVEPLSSMMATSAFEWTKAWNSTIRSLDKQIQGASQAPEGRLLPPTNVSWLKMILRNRFENLNSDMQNMHYLRFLRFNEVITSHSKAIFLFQNPLMWWTFWAFHGEGQAMRWTLHHAITLQRKKA